jgi:membrane associated rhomboid family serine protease
MFIIPVGDRVNWKRPPVITLMLILINCFVFFFFQGGDEKNDRKAMEYYFSSELPNWELNRYSKYLEKEGDPAETQQFNEMLAKKDSFALMFMEHDVKFMRDLHAGIIVTPQDAEYAAWSAQRAEYESRRSFTDRYVYQVDERSPLKAFVSAFMHGSFLHLFFNMLVLFLVGFLVESVIGKALYTLAYFVAIFGSVLMYSLTSPGTSCLGASGAIAGVMGLYTVIFGFRKIDFFYSLGFYFDYVKAPAIALLPLWLGNELYQFLTEKGAHIGYMAHFGGLLSGAVMGALYRWQRPAQIESHHQEAESKAMDGKAFQRGMDYLGEMEFQKALDVFKTLEEHHPNDANLTRLVFRAAKANPSSEDYHRAALKLLASTEMDAATSNSTHAVFQEYLGCAKPSPRLGQDLIAKLAKRFAGSSYCDDAEKLASLLQRMAPQHAALPGVMLALARGHYREQRKDKFEATLQALISKYPQSIEAETAAGMLRIA